jgi:hypothetical protein
MNKQRVKELRRLRNQAFAEVMRWDAEVDLAKAEAIAAERRLGTFLDKLNSYETLWRRLKADDFIAAHRRRIAEAHFRKDEAWRMLVKAKEQEAAIYSIHAKERLDDLCFQWEMNRRRWKLCGPHSS